MAASVPVAVPDLLQQSFDGVGWQALVAEPSAVEVGWHALVAESSEVEVGWRALVAESSDEADCWAPVVESASLVVAAAEPFGEVEPKQDKPDQ